MSSHPKTAWDNPDFVSAWNETYGLDMSRAPIRPGSVYPWIEKNIGAFSGKSLIDIGCGNGNLIRHFLKADFYKWLGIDSGNEIIRSAATNIVDERVTFTHVNPAAEFPFRETGIDYDIATAVFVLEEIPNEDFPRFCQTIYTLLKDRGKALIFSNHPANVVYEDLLQAADPQHPVKFQKLKGYFDDQPSEYTLSVLNQERKMGIKTPYHHKNVSAIMNGFADAGLNLKNMLEIPLGVINIASMQERIPQSGDTPRFIAMTFEKATP